MARVTTVKSAKKDQGTCGRCGDPIPVGAGYRHASPGFRSSKLVRCLKNECSFRPSELTTSKMAGVYAAQEAAHEDLDALDGTDFEDVDEVQGILTTCADDAREVAAEYTEAADAMGAAGEEMTERADTIEGWCDDLECVSFEDEPEPLGEDPSPDQEEAHEEAMSEWREGVLDEARQVIDGFEG